MGDGGIPVYSASSVVGGTPLDPVTKSPTGASRHEDLLRRSSRRSRVVLNLYVGQPVQPQFLLVLGVSSCMLVDPSTGRLSSSFLFIERLIRVFRLSIND